MGNKVIQQWLVSITFVVMVVMNVLANALPLNGIPTGAVSDAYPNLFAPAGFTFSIWSLIYLLLAGFVVYQWNRWGDSRNPETEKLISPLRGPFILTSVVNALWLLAWHYDLIALSTVLMLVLLLVLIYATGRLQNKKLSVQENLWLRAPFSIYFGWITVATIANITILLVKWDWDGFGLSDTFWVNTILITGIAIVSLVVWRRKDLYYAGVILWAYFGILSKHQAADGWNGQFPAVILTVYVCLALTALLFLYTLYRLRNVKKT